MCTIITLLSLLKYLSIPKHQFHWNTMLLRMILWYWSGWFAVSSDRTVVEESGRGKLRVVFWAINLLNPTLAAPIICPTLSTRYWVIAQLSIKLRWHLLSCWPLSLRCYTDCHYRHALSSSTRSIELLLQNIYSSGSELISQCACIYLWINVWIYCVVCQGCRHVNMF